MQKFYTKERDSRGSYARVNVEFHQAWYYASKRIWWNAVDDCPDILMTVKYVNHKLDGKRIITGDFDLYYSLLPSWIRMFPDHRDKIEELRSRMVMEKLSREQVYHGRKWVMPRNDNLDLS